MSDTNSYAEFVLGVYRAQLVDCARQYPELAKEFNRDLQRLSSAVKCHGIRFFLDTMPSYRKHFDKCLSAGRLTQSGMIHFGSDQKGGTIPRLFRGLVLRVFDRSGLLKDQPDVGAIRWVRQLLGVVRKLRMSASLKDTRESVREFYQVDGAVRRGTLNWDDHDAFRTQATTIERSFTDLSMDSVLDPGDLFGDHTTPPVDLFKAASVCQQVADIFAAALGYFDPIDWKPRHGPGAVSDHAFGSYKYDFKRWSDRLESVFPYADFAVANYACVSTDSLEEARASGFSHEPPARLCAVPKTIKAPRLIAAEPSSHQWCQQIIRDFFYRRCSSSIIGNFVDFRRQDLNGSLALRASRDGSHATIDLSSASDRISCWHVERLFRRSPDLLLALQASRSVWIRQDICRISPRYYYLRKYSTMGNATTFPVQSIFFLTLAVSALLMKRGIRPSERAIAALGRQQVRVFGDDIIVPKDCSGTLVGILEAFSLKVNTAKTFEHGLFRESCGVDAYGGQDVTTINILEYPRRTAPSSIVSTVDSHNNLDFQGYWATSEWLRKTAERLGYKKIRRVKHGDGAFGWATFEFITNDGFRTRRCADTQRLQIQCLEPIARVRRNPAVGDPGLLQYFTEAAKKVTSARSSLGYLSRRPKTSLGLRWANV